MQTIGQNIRYYRKQRGYSQEKLAEMADINDKLIRLLRNRQEDSSGDQPCGHR